MPPSLLFVNQHYAPDVAATGQCLADLAEHLAADGYEVDVLASRGRYGAGQGQAPHRETRNGVHVTRLASTGFGRRTHLGRLLDYASFYLGVLVKLLVGRRYDGVIFLTTPPLVSVIGRIARAVRGQRYGIWSMDLHPEAELAAGMLRPGALLTRVVSALDAAAYRGADFVVDLGAYMRARVLKKGVSPARAFTVNIWGGRADAAHVGAQNPLAKHFGLDGKYVVMYSGNAGIVHDFTVIFEAMQRLRGDPRIFFLFVGGGPRRPEVEAFARAEGIPNFAYHDYVPRELLPYSLSVGHVHLISLRTPFVGVSVPSKLYGVMGAGRPVVFIGPQACETADAIRDARCGIVIDPDSDHGAGAGTRLADVLRGWSDVPDAGEELGARGRCAFVERYDHRLSCAEFERVIRASWGVGPTLPTRRWPRTRVALGHAPSRTSFADRGSKAR